MSNLACISQATSLAWQNAAIGSEFGVQTYRNEDWDAVLDHTTCRDMTCSVQAPEYTEFYGAQPVYANGPNEPSTGVTCYCFNSEVRPLDIVPARDAMGTCQVDDVGYYSMAGFTFVNPSCTAFPLSEPGGLTEVATISECYAQCADLSIANIIPITSRNNYYCWCRSELPTRPAAICESDNSVFSFRQDVAPQPSGIVDARKRRLARAAAKRMGKGGDMEFCPRGLSACRIAKTDENGYECIDTLSELESCGACRYGAYQDNKSDTGFSADCTATPGIPLGGSTCIQGKCVAMACAAGFTLVEGECYLA